MIKKHVETIILAILAGLCIGIGGVVYLSVDNKIIGAFLFSIGLLLIVTFKLNLFTGKVCFLPDNKISYLITLAEIWLGNFIGTWLIANLIKLTRLTVSAEKICEIKLNDDLLSIFVLSIMCGILMFGAVVGYLNIEGSGRYIVLILPVAVFILCGFEHCVANMFYISLSGGWDLKSILYLLIMTLGNGIGGVLIPLSLKITNNKKASG